MKQFLKFEYRITAAYLLIGGIWIIFSDKILNLFVSEAELLTQIQTYKGWFYVIVTGILFYLLLKKHLERLRKAEQVAKESDRLKTAFLQNISHEIRTPMNGIIGFTGLLESNDLTENKKREYLKIISRSSNQLLTIVNDVLDISMIESGNIEINKEQVNLNILLDELYEIFKPQVKKDVTFLLEKSLNNIDSEIITDKTKLRQIIYNLIHNSIKFTEKGQIKFGYTIKKEMLEFYVKDSGIGIEQETQHKIFERFSKASKNNFKLYDGIGLGLAICKGNIDLLGGKIDVKSNIKTGTEFTVTIHYKKVLNENIPSKNEQQHPNFKFLLIVEDDDLNFRYVQEILQQQKIPFQRAKNGKEAVQMCYPSNNYNLILMDIKMPEMDGYQAFEEIRKFDRDIPIIAQTAFSLEEEKEKAMHAGFNDFIAKPFQKEEFIRLINKFQLHSN